MSSPSPNCVLRFGNISFCSICLVSGFDNSARSVRKGLFELPFSCNTGSILYHAIFPLLYPLRRSLFNPDSGNKPLFCGMDASVQLINGKRRSILERVPSKSSKYTWPLLSLLLALICLGCPGCNNAASP